MYHDDVTKVLEQGVFGVFGGFFLAGMYSFNYIPKI